MIRILIFITFFLSSQYAFADEESDKAEFKKLYAEFNDLYTNSKEIDPIIEVAEKLYKLSPELYGKDSQNTAVVTYNLASLYDEKGGDTNSDDEKKAFELYQQYFKILDTLNSDQNLDYLLQYISFMKAEYNVMKYRSDKSYSEKALKLANSLNLSNLELANLTYTIAMQRYYSDKQRDAKKLLIDAESRYIKEYNENHLKVGEVIFWTAKIDLNNNDTKEAEQNFLRALDILDKMEDENASAMVLIIHSTLVRIYSERGDHDKATKHCIAYAFKRPKEFETRTASLYSVNPKYPNKEHKIAAENNTSITMEYDVDENGYTKNIKAPKNANKKLVKAIVSAIEKYRYAPYIENGKTVGIDGLQAHFMFDQFR